MCPCPFCTAIAILLAPLLFFKPTRAWLKKKIKKHHGSCDVCQQAEHEMHLKEHTVCHCNACRAAEKKRHEKSKSGLGKRRTTSKTNKGKKK